MMKATQTDMKVFESMPAGWFSKSEVTVRGFESRMKRLIALKMVEPIPPLMGAWYRLLPVDMICDGCWETGLQSDLEDGDQTEWGGTIKVCPHCGHDTFYGLKNAELKAGEKS